MTKVIERGRVVELHESGCTCKAGDGECRCRGGRVISRPLWEQLGRPATLEQYLEARRASALALETAGVHP